MLGELPKEKDTQGISLEFRDCVNMREAYNKAIAEMRQKIEEMMR